MSTQLFTYNNNEKNKYPKRQQLFEKEKVVWIVDISQLVKTYTINQEV